MAEVVILGGGCNPVGSHHAMMVIHLWHRLQIPTWLMPCYGHQFAKDSELIEASHRWNMVTEVVSEWSPDHLVACDWEIAHQHNGSMFEAMRGLTRDYPEVQFRIAIGMDNANKIDDWDRGRFLIELFPFVIFERPGEKTAPWCEKRPHEIISFDNPMSSSKIRSAIADGQYEFAERHLSRKVWDYIKAGKLYGYKGHE